ncbi:hypothetical protein [Kribbella sp. NPDC048915]|uniref:hypothetical protein n=1 Tax=Kribbella sp. NPDC048915 TaxID=3155148 RepID=UPI0033C2EE3B
MNPVTGQDEPTRAEVQVWWEDVVAGRRTRTEASDWADPWVQANFMGEELVLQALVYLHAMDLAVDGLGDAPRHQSGSDSKYLVSEADMARALSRWLQELSVYDEDPDGWTVRHFQKMVRNLATRSGADRARSFGAKLVAAGHLTTADVLDALR